MNSSPKMTCDWCKKEFDADPRACVEAGVSAEPAFDSSESWKHQDDKPSDDQIAKLKSEFGLTDDEVEDLLEDGEVDGLGAIICLDCQDKAISP